MADQHDLAHAATLLDLGRHGEAEVLLRRVVAADPDNAAPLRLLAQAVNGQGRPEEAAPIARHALALDPEDGAGHLVLCDILDDLGQHGEHLHVAQRYVALEPHSWMAHYALARALLSAGRPRQAFDAADLAVRLAPNYSATHTLMGMCLAELRDRPGAARAYHNALALNPHDTMAQNNLAVLHLESGRLTSGAATLRRAVGEAPQEKVLRANLDTVLLLLCRRIMWSLLVTAALLAVLLLSESPSWARAVVGVAYLAALGTLLHRFRAHLPSGISRWGRGIFRRATWQGRYLLALLTLASICALFLAFAPFALAAAAGLLLFGVLRILGFIMIGYWVVAAAVRLTRS